MSVIAVRNGLPGPEVWLIVRRDRVTGEIKDFFVQCASENTGGAVGGVERRSLADRAEH